MYIRNLCLSSSIELVFIYVFLKSWGLAGLMTLWQECLTCKRTHLILNPQHLCKKPLMAGENRWIIGAPWPLILADKREFQFSKRPCLKSISLSTVEEHDWQHALVSTYTPVHSHNCIKHMHAQVHTGK